MPEGPSLVILKEAIAPFKGKKVLAADGYGKLDFSAIKGKKITDIKTWGKHLLICFKDITVRVHLMMFGSYRINEQKKTNPKLSLHFAKGEFINFYACNIKLIEEDLDEVYDWSADIMSPHWSGVKALKKLKAHPDMLATDALLDQDIFSGSGNIIKNEVLFRTRVHPKSLIGEIPLKKQKELIAETHKYAFEFLEWKKKGVLKRHWEAYAKKTCPRDKVPFHKEYLGAGKRRTFFCDMCQVLYK